MADSERRGIVTRVLGFVEDVLHFWERLWSLLVVGGLFAFSVVLYVLYIVRSE